MLFSDESATCSECLEQDFTMEYDLIRDLGKFQGEPLATYHAWHFAMDGFQDDTVTFGSEDYTSEVYDRIGNVILSYSEAGFVYGDVSDTEEEAIAKMEELAAKAAEEEEEEEETEEEE